MVNKDVNRSMSHGLDCRLLASQSQAMEVPVVQRKATWDTYEQEFKSAVQELKKAGVEGIVFGDIELEGHRGWIESVCAELDVTPIMPLWGAAPVELLLEFISEGFEAIVVSAKSDYFGQEWLGRKLDEGFITELRRCKTGVHPCGEYGEYHTLVTNGPLFKKGVQILKSRKVLKDGYWFLDLSSWRLT
jgi:uncharacterized protein (TIGR00290 family)